MVPLECLAEAKAQPLWEDMPNLCFPGLPHTKESWKQVRNTQFKIHEEQIYHDQESSDTTNVASISPPLKFQILELADKKCKYICLLYLLFSILCKVTQLFVFNLMD